MPCHVCMVSGTCNSPNSCGRPYQALVRPWCIVKKCSQAQWKATLPWLTLVRVALCIDLQSKCLIRSELIVLLSEFRIIRPPTLWLNPAKSLAQKTATTSTVGQKAEISSLACGCVRERSQTSQMCWSAAVACDIGTRILMLRSPVQKAHFVGR